MNTLPASLRARGFMVALAVGVDESELKTSRFGFFERAAGPTVGCRKWQSDLV